MKKAKKIIGIVLVLLVLSVAVFGVVYLKTDVLDFMKSPKAMFFKYMGRTFEGISAEAPEGLITDKSYVSNSKATWELNAKGDRELQKTLDIVNDLALEVETKNEAGGKKSSTSIDVTHGRDSLINLVCVFDGTGTETLSLAMPDVLDEYITIENKNLQDLVEKFGLDSEGIPDKLDFDVSYEDLFLTKEQIEELKEKYTEVIKGAIDDANFEKGKEDITVNGNKMKANAYTLTLSEKETVKLLIEILKEVKKDDTILDYIIGVFETLDMPLDDLGMDTLRKSDIKEMVDMLIEELKYVDASSDKYKITVYEHKGETVRIKFAIDKNNAIVFDKTTDKNETDMKISLIVEKEELFAMDIKVVEDGNKTETTFSMKVEDDYTGEEVTVAVKIVTTKDNTYEELVFFVDTEEASIRFNITNKRTFKDVKIDTIRNSNVLNSMTEEEMEDFIERFGNALLNYYENNDKFNELIELITELSGISGGMPDVLEIAESQEQELFNVQFTKYAGIQTASAVKALMTIVKSSNGVDDLQVEVEALIDGETYDDPSEIQSLLNASESYFVELVYEDGYITQIIIEEM